MQTTAQLWLVYKLDGFRRVARSFWFCEPGADAVSLLDWRVTLATATTAASVIVTQTCSMILAFALAALTLDAFDSRLGSHRHRVSGRDSERV